MDGLKGHFLSTFVIFFTNDICQADQWVATQTVDISGASATMQAGGMPRRGQDLPNATPSTLESE